ncbi:MAG: menaquinone biosynthesis protein [Desulfobacterales bacterium]|nr:menaquinone biosynthesis protein [Desulfobacterales bacterium]
MVQNQISARLGKINYTNVEPIYYGFSNGINTPELDLIDQPPTILNKMMKENGLDIGPVSSFAYALNHNDWYIIPGFSVSCFNDVMSVLLASNYKIKDLNNKNVAFSNESASSVNLCKLLFLNYNVDPLITTTKVESSKSLSSKYDAALVIGDSALNGNWNKYKYIYDLGELWCKKRKVPFTFALWVVRKEFAINNKKVVQNVISKLNSSKQIGLKNLRTIADFASEKLAIDKKITLNYFNKLNFDLGIEQQSGLQMFYDELFHNNLIPEKVTLNFFE